MEALLIKLLTEAFTAGGIWAVIAFALVVLGVPIGFAARFLMSMRKELTAERLAHQATLAACNDGRTEDLKTTIAEATKCMQVISTSMTNLMVAMEHGTRSNESRVKSWETFGTSLELFGRVLNTVSEDMRDIRREMARFVDK